jgi:hypothetical protein
MKEELLMDSDDVEGWLVEEGIGFYNRSGNFEYGMDPEPSENDMDFNTDFESEPADDDGGDGYCMSCGQELNSFQDGRYFCIACGT